MQRQVNMIQEIYTMYNEFTSGTVGPDDGSNEVIIKLERLEER